MKYLKKSFFIFLTLSFSLNSFATNIDVFGGGKEASQPSGLEPYASFDKTISLPDFYDKVAGDLTSAGVEENRKRLCSLIHEIGASPADVIFLACAPGFRGDQVIPGYITNLVESTQKSVAIFSVDPFQFSRHNLNDFPRELRFVDFDTLGLKMARSTEGLLQWVADEGRLVFTPFSAFLPNDFLDAAYMESFYKELARVLRLKLEEGRTVIVGNYISYDPQDLEPIWKIFNQQFSEKWLKYFVFYTKCGGGDALLQTGPLPRAGSCTLSKEDPVEYNFKRFNWDGFDPLKDLE